MRKSIYAFAIAILLALFAVGLTSAGGWAVVTLDQLPTEVVAGKPITIGFMVRQHGRTPVNELVPRIAATRANSIESFSVIASQRGVTGHYEATLTFQSAGTWDWKIDAFSFPQPMPSLAVTEASSVKTTNVAQIPMIPVASIIAAIGAIGALLFWWRTRKRVALALVLIGAAISIAGFAFAANGTATTPTRTAKEDYAGMGKALFVAKGCIVCHQQGELAAVRRDFSGLIVGPDLTNVKLDAGYLHEWLRKPSALKPNTEMPTLGLTEEEIDALTIFLVGE
ncbi:hypothetical protein ANRL1_01839 [Anaerolineae bacterium]|nr:hypothetical protein ANRL1_01839 [Anaerolineae bacterium]